MKIRSLTFILLGSIALLIAACGPAPEPTATPTPTETPTLIPSPTVIPPTQTPIIVTVVVTQDTAPTAAPAPDRNNTGAFATRTSCTVNADWTTTYRVQSGDTVGRIASATGSTVAAITNGNCLANANNIFVGQVLRVPQPPVFGNPAEETEDATEEATEDATEETEDATEETEDATEEATEDATEDATEEATEDATEEVE
jgi:LysM repeat protein